MIRAPLTHPCPAVHLLLSPLSWCLFATIVFVWARGRRAGWLRWPAVLLWLFSVLLMTPAGANLLLGSVERAARRAVLVDCASSQGTPTQPSGKAETAAGGKPSARVGILLAGGFDRPASSADDLAALTPSSYVRAVHAARLFQQGRIQNLLITGGSEDGVPESAVLAQLVQRLGVPAARIEIERSSLSTWENARQVKAAWPKLATPAGSANQPLLITTALHMPRALWAFQAAGLMVCPAPTDWRHVPFSWSAGYFAPQLTALGKSEDTLHELLGYASYWARQRWR